MLSAAPTPAQAPQRTRCRQIVEADLDGLADLLARGFSRSSPDYWRNGFARFRALPVIEGVPRYGYVLEAEAGIVGAILLIPSRRGDTIFSNLSSWYVEPAWRAHSTMLIAMATKLKHVTYVNISPAPHTWKTLQAQGFRQYSFGRSAIFSVIGGGVVSEVIPADLPEHNLLADHAAMGCISLVCKKDGIVSPFVFRRKKLDRPPLPMAELIFCRGAGDLRACAGALGRWLMRRGMAGMIVDGKVSSAFSHYADGKEPRYFKGPHAPNDLAYTERVIFG
ncbi:MAG TPA: hypothetical protein VIJ85_05565 [Rhizomicrobium sp.]